MGEYNAEIHYYHADDWEQIKVLVNGEELDSVTTSYECPEDNSVSRLLLVEFAKTLLEQATDTVTIERHEYGVDPDDD